MLTYLRHLVRENFDQILAGSLMNCHVRGLHSVLFVDHSVRMFYAAPDHELENNLWFALCIGRERCGPMSLAIHPHRYNITFECIYGKFMNYIYQKSNSDLPRDPLLADRFEYNSHIVDGAIGFKRVGSERFRLPESRTLVPGDVVAMFAKDLHTIVVREKQEAAWMVYEGQEDPDYRPICYSNTDLTVADFSDLYRKPTRNELIHILKRVGIWEE